MSRAQGADAGPDDLTTMFCKRIALQVKRAKPELESIREQQQAIVEALIGNYRTVPQHADGPVQAARFGDQLAPGLHTMAKALRAQAGALGAPPTAVDDLGGFEGQYEHREGRRPPRQLLGGAAVRAPT
ncbi:hypothetical protein [Streptomyces sp. NPDC058665]|uniref:hypothetical protein n=1 Tax=Streptomyces sp. NPDC058665 TaxID=3346586 RepID=UPI003655EB77